MNIDAKIDAWMLGKGPKPTAKEMAQWSKDKHNHLMRTSKTYRAQMKHERPIESK